ncbi:hypothetical protein CspHIS471_0206720 [Cutaneotrichosporon sp. HIS471]|nr:hypothetical protein CspHIS471_0206720 [Cutaneotrichosporon sp. HIS471]
MLAPVRVLIKDILSSMSAELERGGDSPLDERDIFASVVRDLLALSSTSPTPTAASSPTTSDPSSNPSSSLRDTLSVRLRALLTIARQRVEHIPFHLVSGATLRGYTDASVLLAVLFLIDGRGEWKDIVQILDRAIIVAGAVGSHRLEWVQALIAALQPPGLPHHHQDLNGSSCPNPPPPSPPASEPLFAPNPIPTPSTPPPLTTAPFLLRSYLASGTHHPPWPALSRWQSSEYLVSKTGHGRIVPVECGRAYDDSGWTQRLVDWESFLQRSGWDPAKKGKEDGGPQYLAQTSLFRQFRGLETDMALPDYVWAETPDEYKAPPEVLVNAWIGPGGHEVVSPAHTDPYYNCYAQVLGYKRVWVAPPDASPHMYAYAGQAATDASLAEEYMGNTSRVPLLRPALDETFRAQQSTFPAFFKHVYPHAMEAVLGPGDMLVMPPGWWHAMRGEGEGPCWSVSFWF